MKQQPFSEMTVEELRKTEKQLSRTSIILTVCIAIMFLAGAFLTFRKGFSGFTVLPVAFLPIAMMNFKNLKKIRAELAARN